MVKKIEKNMSYMLQYIDSARFMASSLSNLVNTHKIKCKSEHNKKFETRRTKYKYCDCFLEYPNFKDDLIEHR